MFRIHLLMRIRLLHPALSNAENVPTKLFFRRFVSHRFLCNNVEIKLYYILCHILIWIQMPLLCGTCKPENNFIRVLFLSLYRISMKLILLIFSESRLSTSSREINVSWNNSQKRFNAKSFFVLMPGLWTFIAS